MVFDRTVVRRLIVVGDSATVRFPIVKVGPNAVRKPQRTWFESSHQFLRGGIVVTRLSVDSFWPIAVQTQQHVIDGRFLRRVDAKRGVELLRHFKGILDLSESLCLRAKQESDKRAGEGNLTESGLRRHFGTEMLLKH